VVAISPFDIDKNSSNVDSGKYLDNFYQNAHDLRTRSVEILTVCAFILRLYCDMMPERRKCAVRETPQRRPLLDNGSLNTFPQQRIGTVIEELLEVVISIRFFPKV
jgi:hypothetical protein